MDITDKSNFSLATLAGHALFHQSCGTVSANPNSPCSSRPAQIPLKLEEQSNPINFSQIYPNSTGYFEIKSLPGNYVIRLMEENEIMSAPPKTLLLKAGEKTEITFRIRALAQ